MAPLPANGKPPAPTAATTTAATSPPTTAPTSGSSSSSSSSSISITTTAAAASTSQLRVTPAAAAAVHPPPPPPILSSSASEPAPTLTTTTDLNPTKDESDAAPAPVLIHPASQPILASPDEINDVKRHFAEDVRRLFKKRTREGQPPHHHHFHLPHRLTSATQSSTDRSQTPSHRHTIMELPDRLRGGDSSSEEDVVPTQGPSMFMNMNQSIFGFISAVGTRADLTDRFGGDSSDDEDEDGSHAAQARSHHPHHHNRHASGKSSEASSISKTTIFRKKTSNESSDSDKSHRRKLSDHKLLRSLPALPRLSKSKSRSSKASGKEPSTLPTQSEDAAETTEPAMTASTELTAEENRLAPVMSRMLEARAEMSSRPSFDLDRLSGDHARTAGEDGEEGPSLLAKKLMEIFEFDEPETVVEEYPCWLLQSVLLQGYMYITAKHICFYAYLPKKSHEVAKSGYLSKSGKRNPKYNRFWFRLKGDVLSYYQDASNLYFPHGQIDLRYGISASITDKDKDAVHFSVVMPNRTYNFRADSAPSAKEWVKSIQRVIFRSHNDGDSVKISLPIENIIEVEETQMIEFADTCKIRVFDNDETYAIDEYYFSFFSFGKQAINVLKILTEGTQTKHRQQEMISAFNEDEAPERHSKAASSIAGRHSPGPAALRTKLPEPVRATLSPMSPHSPANMSTSSRASMDAPRSSMDALRHLGGRKSLDVAHFRDQSPRRSFSTSHRSLSRPRRDPKVRTPEKQGSTDSYVQSSMEEPSFSALVASSNEDPSASQILRGSEVFQSPTIRRSLSAANAVPKPLETHSSQPSRVPSAGPTLYSTSHAATTGHLVDTGAGEKLDKNDMTATPSLQSIARMSAYPLQRATAFAEYLSKSSKRMSSLLSVEPMGYVEKVSGMWKGGHRHYEPSSLRSDDEDEADDEKSAKAEERFRQHFALSDSETLKATYYGYLFRVLPLYGKVYLGDRHFCFRSMVPGTRTKLILPIKDVETVEKEKGFRLGWEGMVVVVRGHEELFFEFGKTDQRDDCAITLLQTIETARFLKGSGILHQDEREDAANAKAERDALSECRQEEFPEHELRLPRQTSGLGADAPTILFDDPKASFLNFKPAQPLKVTCLTIGSRGDVQPYIALCKGLLAEGHKPKIATHLEFKDWIEGHGIEFAEIGGDPAELMRLCIEYGTFTIQFLKVANAMFRGWLDNLLASAWDACQGSDVLIESPSAMAGIHIAEALSIPYFRAFTMPWTRTRAYPHAFVMPEYKMGGAYNYLSYVMFDNVFWKASSGQINKWRNSMLKLPSTNLDKLQQNKVPFLYNFSPSVVAPPLDFSDWIRVTGYWFLDEGPKWTPPQDLTDFIAKARKDDKKLVYVGFGSIIVNDTAKMTQEVIDAVLKADVRCILSKGWSDRTSADPNAPKTQSHDEPKMPDEIFVIKSAPHDWLFKQIDAAAHHGGSGTTGASLRAGIPTIIRPFFGDQFFFGSRVEDIGVGICLKKWGSMSFARALWEATHNERMIVKAKVLGEQIRKEDGVATAIQAMYRDMEYAKSLIKRKTGRNAHPHDEDAEDDEESWTFVGSDEPDPDMTTKRLSDGLGGPSVGSAKVHPHQNATHILAAAAKPTGTPVSGLRV